MAVDNRCSPLKTRMLALLANTETHDLRLELRDVPKEDVAKQSLTAHRMILAELSEPFGRMLRGNFSEVTSDTVRLSNLSWESLGALINFAYTGEVSIPRCGEKWSVGTVLDDKQEAAQVLLDLLRFSDQWQIIDLGDICEDMILSHHLSLANAVEVVNFACALQQTRRQFLVRACEFLCSFALNLIEDGSFPGLWEDALREILQQGSMFIRREEDLLEAICQWVKANIPDDVAQQKLKVQQLLHYLQRQSLSAENVRDILMHHGLSFEYEATVSPQELATSSSKGRVKLQGFHFNAENASPSVEIDAYCRKVVSRGTGLQVAYMDRDLIEASGGTGGGGPTPVEWHIQVKDVHQFIFVGVGSPIEINEQTRLPCNGSGFASNGDLYQAVIQNADAANNRFASRRVQRLKFSPGSELSFVFSVGQLQPGLQENPADWTWVQCSSCRSGRRHPYAFAHRHATITVHINSTACRRYFVAADIVVADGIRLYPFVVLKRPGDCVEIVEK